MLQHQHTFLFDKLKKKILIEDYSFNQRHKIIVSNGIIILSVSKIKWVAENEIVVKCQKSPIFFLSNFPQCDNNQATSKFESHVPSIIKKKKKEWHSCLSQPLITEKVLSLQKWQGLNYISSHSSLIKIILIQLDDKLRGEPLQYLFCYFLRYYYLI